jgi:DEAD/DEAH box helicase domain-containing protein
LEQRRAVATAENVEYFTSPLADKETEILEILRHSQQGELTAWLGRVRVRERVVGYERKRLMGQQGSGPQALSQHPLDLPPTEFETVGLWWAAPRHLQASLEQREEHYMGSLHACEHAAISLLPTLLLCDRGDIGGISQPFHPQVGCGAIFIYDGHSGGVGIAEAAFDQVPELLARVRDLLITCPCEVGCPSCVQSPKCGNGNRPLDKAGALRLARLLLGEEAPVEKAGPRPEITLLAPAAAEPVRSTGSPFREAEPSPGAEPAAGEPRPKKAPSKRAPSKRARSKSAPFAELSSGEISSAETGAEAVSSDADPSELSPSGAPPSEVRGPETAESRQPQRPPRASPRKGGAGRGEDSEDVPMTVLFDIETRRSADDVGGWGQIHRMGVAVAVVCYLEENRFEIFHEDRVWELAAALRAASLVVGFNSRRFDYRVLNGYTGEDYSRTLKTLDLLEEVEKRLGHRLSLSHLCQETLGADKSADGLQSLEWVKQGRLDLVEAYCRKDVELLRDLYLFGRREGYVLYRDRGRGKQRKLPVAW